MYEIAIINPRPRKRKTRKAGKTGRKGAIVAKKRRKRKMTAKQAKFFGPKRKRKVRRARAVKSAAPRRKRKRPAGARSATGYVVGSKRIRRYKLNPRRRHRARRSNPRFSISGITSQLVPAAYGAGGALALDLALGYIPLPAMLKTGYARHATRIVGALGIGWLAGKFLRGKSAAIGSGALTVAMYGLFKDVAMQYAPAAVSSKLGEYEEITVAGYDDPAADLRDGTAGMGRMGAYLGGVQDDNLDGIGAYMTDALGGVDY